MRRFTVTWSTQGSLSLLRARAFLGPARAMELDDELETVRVRLEALPESGHMVDVRGRWSGKLRKVLLSRNPYRLYYRLNLAAEQVVIIALRHQKQRPPRL